MTQPVSSPQSSSWKFLLFIGVFLFLGIGFIVQSFVYRNLNARFDGPVVRVSGVVDKVIQDEGVSTSKGFRSETHRVFYHFSARDGRHDAATTATVTTCNQLAPGAPVPVKYLAADPAESRLDLPAEDASHHQEVWIDLVVGSGSLLLSGFLIRRRLSG
jgi:hypothetical protein